MKPLKYYISDILQELVELVTPLTSNVYVENRPRAASEQIQDMIVVSLPYRIYDEGAYQRTSVRFEIIVKERQGGIAPVDKLQSILDSLTELFPIKGSRFTASTPFLALRGSDGVGWTIWNVQAKMIINTTDRYPGLFNEDSNEEGTTGDEQDNNQ